MAIVVTPSNPVQSHLFLPVVLRVRLDTRPSATVTVTATWNTNDLIAYPNFNPASGGRGSRSFRFTTTNWNVEQELIIGLTLERVVAVASSNPLLVGSSGAIRPQNSRSPTVRFSATGEGTASVRWSYTGSDQVSTAVFFTADPVREGPIFPRDMPPSTGEGWWLVPVFDTPGDPRPISYALAAARGTIYPGSRQTIRETQRPAASVANALRYFWVNAARAGAAGIAIYYPSGATSPVATYALQLRGRFPREQVTVAPETFTYRFDRSQIGSPASTTTYGSWEDDPARPTTHERRSATERRVTRFTVTVYRTSSRTNREEQVPAGASYTTARGTTAQLLQNPYRTSTTQIFRGFEYRAKATPEDVTGGVTDTPTETDTEGEVEAPQDTLQTSSVRSAPAIVGRFTTLRGTTRVTPTNPAWSGTGFNQTRTTYQRADVTITFTRRNARTNAVVNTWTQTEAQWTTITERRVNPGVVQGAWTAWTLIPGSSSTSVLTGEALVPKPTDVGWTADAGSDPPTESRRVLVTWREQRTRTRTAPNGDSDTETETRNRSRLDTETRDVPTTEDPTPDVETEEGEVETGEEESDVTPEEDTGPTVTDDPTGGIQEGTGQTPRTVTPIAGVTFATDEGVETDLLVLQSGEADSVWIRPARPVNRLGTLTARVAREVTITALSNGFQAQSGIVRAFWRFNSTEVSVFITGSFQTGSIACFLDRQYTMTRVGTTGGVTQYRYNFPDLEQANRLRPSAGDKIFMSVGGFAFADDGAGVSASGTPVWIAADTDEDINSRGAGNSLWRRIIVNAADTIVESSGQLHFWGPPAGNDEFAGRIFRLDYEAFGARPARSPVTLVKAANTQARNPNDLEFTQEGEWIWFDMGSPPGFTIGLTGLGTTRRAQPELVIPGRTNYDGTMLIDNALGVFAMDAYYAGQPLDNVVNFISYFQFFVVGVSEDREWMRVGLMRRWRPDLDEGRRKDTSIFVARFDPKCRYEPAQERLQTEGGTGATRVITLPPWMERTGKALVRAQELSQIPGPLPILHDTQYVWQPDEIAQALAASQRPGMAVRYNTPDVQGDYRIASIKYEWRTRGRSHRAPTVPVRRLELIPLPPDSSV